MTAEHDTDARDALDALHSELTRRWPESQIEPSLDRIGRLMELLGDPQHTSPVIHITGTNGKTSTARMIESLLRSFGLRTGLYTSPHLTSVTERILLDGEPVDATRFVETYDDIEAYIQIVDAESVTSGGPAMSYFEVMTALAFAVFADAPVDVAIVEVGMGGQWDATNVANGRIAVVTPIGIDHVEYLGDTIEAIATEKSGIIKPEATAVLAIQQPAAAAVLLARCVATAAVPLREGIEFSVVSREIAVGGQLITVQTTSGGGDIDTVYPELLIPLHGAHQSQNAAVALAAVEAFLTDGTRSLDLDIVREGFAAATSPARLEVVRRSPTVLVDAAHNPHGVAALAQALGEAFSFDHVVAVLAVLGDKDVNGILEALEPVVNELVVTQNRSPRALDRDDLAQRARAVFGDERVTVADSVPEALDVALERVDEAGLGSGLLVTGSVVTAAEARELLGPRGVA